MELIEGVILAAGLSKRTGVCKMLLDLGGITLIERCITGMYRFCSKIVVVGGHNFENIGRVIAKYQKVRMVYNPHYREGMFSSAKEGFKNVSGDRIFFIPGDYPLVTGETYGKMLGAEGDIIVPLFNGENGHPILIRGHLVEELLAEGRYSTLREFISDKGYIPVPVRDPGILKDIDTMEDYDRVKESIPGL
ncbi:MAG TPA: nucleotidyltransferase family protein [Clostridia bacterium]|nr:nucleotidyltransferase family protein [Clostridia bacterium]